MILLDKLYEPFQLTTSQGGRPTYHFAIVLPDLFQLTTSQGGRPFFPTKSINNTNGFQLTTSQGGRRVPTAAYINQPNIFQLTTSQGGRHTLFMLICIYGIISTHDLARRSTP